VDKKTLARLKKVEGWIQGLESECGAEDQEYIDAWIHELE
jgi:DNA-binding FrmR family transcriptional regulator